MNLWKSFSGMVEVELTSASLEQSFDAIRQKNISVFAVVPVGDLTVRFMVCRKDYPLLQILRLVFQILLNKHNILLFRSS